MSTNDAPQNIYVLCNEVYSRRGQYGVFDFVGQFTNIEWTWCEPCECQSPYDPYDLLRYDDSLDIPQQVVTCLVCGSLNPLEKISQIKAIVLYENGDKSLVGVVPSKVLKFFQKECKGYVEAKVLDSQNITLWFNEEARILQKNFEPNFFATKLWANEVKHWSQMLSDSPLDDTVLLGNVVVTSSLTDKHGYPLSLTDSQIEELVSEV